ncbi:MAG: SDR family oxidoreductase [Pseudomonadota bacterium]
MNPKVLITGGSGLLALNWALTIRDRCSVTLGLHERNISLAGIETRQIDLESVDNLVRAFETVQPQIVIHTAGLTNVEECEARPSLAQHVNVELATNVAKACAKLGLPLVHISTDHLFSGEVPLVDEIQPTAPKNVYGRTKAEAELRVLEVYAQALVIRTNFYGWGPHYRHSFSDWIVRMLRSGSELPLFKDVFYTPTLIETVALAVQDMVNLKASGIFNVVGDERLSKYQFGLKLAEEFNLGSGLIKPAFLAERISLVQRPHDMSLSNLKTCKLLGRKLGGVSEHIARLHQQEKNGLAREIQKP